MKEKLKTGSGCIIIILIIAAIAFVVISQLDFFKSAHPKLSSWVGLIGFLCIPSFLVINGIVQDDRATTGKKVRNTCIYFLIVAAVVTGILLFAKNAPKESRFFYSLLSDMDGDIKMINTPDSSAFKSIGYDRDHNTLVVKFRESGDVYYYYNIPSALWNDFKDSDSLGSFFNDHIKDQYESDKIG